MKNAGKIRFPLRLLPLALWLFIPCLLSGQEPPPARSWSAEDGIELRGHASPALALAMSPDGRTAATGANDRSVILWNTENGKERARLRLSGGVSCLAFSGDGSLLVVGCRDKSATLWTVADGRELSKFPHSGTVTAAALSDDGRFLVSGVDNGQAGLWDARLVKPLFPLNVHQRMISAVAFSPRNNMVALASQDRGVSLWDTTGKQLFLFKKHYGGVEAVAFAPGGARLITGSADKRALIWEARGGKVLHELEGHSAPVTFVAFAPDGRTAYTASQDGLFIQWNAATGKEIVRTQLGMPVHRAAMSRDAYQTIVRDLATKTLTFRTETIHFEEPGKPAPEDKSPFAALPKSPPAFRFNPDMKPQPKPTTGGESPAPEVPLPAAPRDNLVAFHPKGLFVLSVGGDKDGVMWDVQKRDAVYTISHSAPLTAVRFAPSGDQVAVGGRDGSVLLYHPGNGRQERVLRGHTSAVRALAFTADGSRLISAGADHAVVLWDLLSGRLLTTIRAHTAPINAFEMLPDYSRAFSVSDDKTLRAWTTAGRGNQSLQGDVVAEEESPLISLAISPDGKWIATGTEAKTVVVRDTREFKVAATLAGLPEPACSLAFTPDGAFLATGGKDGVLVFWSTETWKAAQTFPQVKRETQERLEEIRERRTVHKQWVRDGVREIVREPIRDIAFSADGRWMLSSGGRESFLWDLSKLKTPPPAASESEKPTPPPTPRQAAAARLEALPEGKRIRLFDRVGAPLTGASLSRDGTRLVVAERSKRLLVFDTATGEEVARHHAKVVQETVIFLPDGRTVLGGGEDGRLFSINTQTDREVFAVKAHTDGLTCLALSPGGGKALSGGNDRIAVFWDTRKGENLGRLNGHRGAIHGVALNRDASRALTASEDRSAILWDTKTLKPIRKQEDHRGPVRDVAFSADGVRMATVSNDRTAVVYQTATGKELARLTGSAAPLIRVAFSPDGNRLLTAGDDGVAVLWDPQTGEPLKRFTATQRPILEIGFTADGNRLFLLDGKAVTLWETSE